MRRVVVRLLRRDFAFRRFRVSRPRRTPSHAIAMHGEPALPADFTHFPYVNPDAPKGGRINYASPGSFDSLNPFIVQGDDGARHVRRSFRQHRLRDADAALARRGLHALSAARRQSIDTDAERKYVEFTLDPKAKFSDGTAGDAGRRASSRCELLRDKGRPLYKRWIDVDRQDGKGRRARRALHLQRQGRPRIAADPGADCRSCRSTPSTRTTSTRRR